MGNPANPAIKMMDKINKARKAERQEFQAYYESMCGPVTIINKTKITKTTTKLNGGTE